jgi:hypothetical protein
MLDGKKEEDSFGHNSEKNQISIFVSKKLKHVRAISTS